MSEQILTQVEVDALLRGLSNGDIKTEAERPGAVDGVKPYDFANQEKTLRGRLQTLDMINEKLSKNLRTALFNLLRKSVDIVCEGVESMKYEDFMRNLQVPSSLNIFQLPPLRGQGLLAIDPNLVFLIVDTYFGGDGRFHMRVEGREFTNVEQSVVKKIVDITFQELREVWKTVHEVKFNYLRSEMNPHFVNIIGNTELVILSTFKMEIESVSYKFFICIPFAVLEPIKEKLMGLQHVGERGLDNRWGEHLRERFGEVPMVVTSELGSTQISVEDLINLKAGDVIQLDRKAKGTLDVTIEGMPKFAGRPGVMDEHYSMKIVSFIKERG